MPDSDIQTTVPGDLLTDVLTSVTPPELALPQWSPEAHDFAAFHPVVHQT